MKKLSMALIAALALAGLIAGCGGAGDDETATVEATLSKAEFIKQADEMCTKSQKRGEQGAEAFAEENGFELEEASEEQLEEAIGAVLVPLLRDQADELQSLGAPRGDEGKVEEIVSSLEGAADEIEADPSLAFDGEPLKEASRMAQDYGFKVCGDE